MDVFDIPDSSPEKARRPLLRGSTVTRKMQPQQTAPRGIQKRRGRPKKAAVGNRTSSASPPKRRKGMPNGTSSKVLATRGSTQTSPRRSSRLSKRTPEQTPPASTLEAVGSRPMVTVGVDASDSIPEESAHVTKGAGGTPDVSEGPSDSLLPQSLHEPAPNDAASEVILAQGDRIALEDNAEDNASNSNADSEASSWTNVSELEQSAAPSFECFGQWDNWLLVKEAAWNVGTVETEHGRRRKKTRIRTTYGKKLLTSACNLTGLYQQLSEIPAEERQQDFGLYICEEIENVYGKLKVAIKGIDSKRLESNITKFTCEVHRVIVPRLIHLLEKTMVALSQVYADSAEDMDGEGDLNSLKRVCHIQSLVVQLGLWIAKHGTDREVQDRGETTEEIIRVLRLHIKPAFDHQYFLRLGEHTKRELVRICAREEAEAAARRQAQEDRTRATIAGRTNLAWQQLANRHQRHGALLAGLFTG